MFLKLYVCIVIVLEIVLVISFIYDLYNEHRREKLHQRRLEFHRYHNLFREGLNEKLFNMNLDEYIEYRKYHFSELATMAFELSDPLNSEFEDFGLKLDYYWDCKKDLNQYQSDIIMLWEEFFDLIDTKLYSYNNYKSDLFLLAKLTRLSDISYDMRNSLDSKLLDYIEHNYPNGPIYNFQEKFEYLLSWASFRLNGYLDIMMLGVTFREVETLKKFWKHFESDFMKLKNENPSLAKIFYWVIRDYFRRFSDKDNFKFRLLYKKVSVWIMEIFKHEDNIKEFSDVVITYKRVARKNKRGWRLFWDYILDYTTGYGEKPHLLIFYFLAFILIFTLVYYPYPFSPFEFKGIDKEDFWLTSIINLLYFNFTTMISNLYGNISPENEITKIFVILQQLIGFTISGSFIALFLRKMFRD